MSLSTLTDDEVERLVLSLLHSRGDRGASKEEMMRVINWANQVRSDKALLDLTLSGDVLVDIDTDGELVFRKSSGEQEQGDADG